MAVTVEQILNKLAARNFPIKLIESGFSSIMEDALAELNSYSPITTFAVFETKDGVQDYAIFDPDDTDLVGFAQNATSINEVYWNPAGDFSSLDVFSPGWFTTSQMTIIRQNLSSWNNQFGNHNFEIIGPVGEPGSVLRLSPLPNDNGIKVLVEFGASLELEQVAKVQISDLMDWVCYYAADALANKYATTAGIELLGFADSTAAMKYWMGRAQWYHDQAVNDQGGIHGQVLRT